MASPFRVVGAVGGDNSFNFGAFYSEEAASQERREYNTLSANSLKKVETYEGNLKEGCHEMLLLFLGCFYPKNSFRI